MLKPAQSYNENNVVRIVWTSPHCWPDYVLRQKGFGEKSQGGQTYVMYEGSLALAQACENLFIDIYARYEAGHENIVELHPRVRLIRLPLGPTDRYLPKEQFWGTPIQSFVKHVADFAQQRNMRYQLIHGHYADGLYVAQNLSTRWGVPMVYTPHSLGLRKLERALETREGTPADLENKYNFRQRISHEVFGLKKADRICAFTSEEMLYLSSHYAVEQRKIRIIPNAITQQAFYPPRRREAKLLRERLQLGPNEMVVLLVARLDPRKGQGQLIEAAPFVLRDLKAANKRVKFLFVGWNQTDFAKHLEARAEQLGISSSIIYHPPVARTDISKFYWISTVYSLSSTYDIAPIALLESMAAGVPVVATNRGGPSEIVRHGIDGYIVDTTDAQSLAKALSRLLLCRRERDRIRANARHKVIQNHTWARTTEMMLGLYNELLVDGALQTCVTSRTEDK